MENKIIDLINTLYKAAQTTIDYHQDSAKLLAKRLNHVTALLQEIDNLADNIDINVPIAHINSLNMGNNPQEMLQNSVKILVDRNQKTNGRIQNMKLLKDEIEKVNKL
jgi:hypothetical protein